MSPTELQAINAAADGDEDWMRSLERQEQMRNMPRKLLQAHLAVLGWYPVVAARSALQRGNERVFIIVLSDGRVTCGYSEFSKLEQIDVPWRNIPLPHLRVLAHRIARMS